jgi:hypothetical protein
MPTQQPHPSIRRQATSTFTNFTSFLHQITHIGQDVGRARNLEKNNPQILWLHGNMCDRIVFAYTSNALKRVCEPIEQCERNLKLKPNELFAALKPAMDNLVAVMMEGAQFVELCKCKPTRNMDHEVVWMQRALLVGLSTEPADTHLHNFLLATYALDDAIKGVQASALAAEPINTDQSQTTAAAAAATGRKLQSPDQFWNLEEAKDDDGPRHSHEEDFYNNARKAARNSLLLGDLLDKARNNDIEQMKNDLMRIARNPASKADDFKRELARLLMEKLSDRELHHQMVERFATSPDPAHAADARQQGDFQGRMVATALRPSISSISYPALTDNFYADSRELVIMEKIYPRPKDHSTMRPIVDVYKAYWNPAGSDSIFALKKFWGGAQETFNIEAPIHLRLHHPNIVRCLCAFREEDGKSSSFLMEFMDRNLAQYIDDCGTELTLPKQIHIMLEIAKGMEYLHSKGIIHRDLKPENVLVREQLLVEGLSSIASPSSSKFSAMDNFYRIQIKIADFGNSKCINDPKGTFTKNVGTSIYRAPEVMADEQDRYDTSIDVFSFGVLCFKILSGSELFEGDTDRMAKVRKGDRPNLSEVLDRRSCPQYLQRCIETWWDHMPEKRPTFKEICRVLRHLQAVVVQCRGPGLRVDDLQARGLPSFLDAPVDKATWVRLQMKARLAMQELEKLYTDDSWKRKGRLCNHSCANEIPYEMHIMNNLEFYLNQFTHRPAEKRKKSGLFDCFKSCITFCCTKTPIPGTARAFDSPPS